MRDVDYGSSATSPFFRVYSCYSWFDRFLFEKEHGDSLTSVTHGRAVFARLGSAVQNTLFPIDQDSLIPAEG